MTNGSLKLSLEKNTNKLKKYKSSYKSSWENTNGKKFQCHALQMVTLVKKAQVCSANTFFYINNSNIRKQSKLLPK